MNKRELVRNAIAEMSKRRAAEEQKREEANRISRERQAEELRRVLEAHPYLREYEPVATGSGIWIVLPECHAIKVSGWGGQLAELTYGIAKGTSTEAAPQRWIMDIYEAVEIAHDAYNGN